MTAETQFRRGCSGVSMLHVDLVFVTKYRRGVLTDELLTLCEEVVRNVCSDFEAALVEFDGEHDHVHLHIEYPPKVSISKLVNSLRGVSARKLRDGFRFWINRHSMNGHLWSPSYFAASCGGASLSVVKQYIEDQRRPGGAEKGRLMR